MFFYNAIVKLYPGMFFKRNFLFFFLLLVLFLFSSSPAFAKDNIFKNYRILACLSSYNRPIFVSAQVLRLLRQSYPVDISVSIKGLSPEFVENALEKEWSEGIKSGRIIVRISPNRDQYSNFLDTVRDVDIERWDYFCKIDDDDWYGPDYFKNVNEWLNKEDDIVMSYTLQNMIIRQANNIVTVTESNYDWFGPSMCYSRKLIKKALWLEKHPAIAETYVRNFPLSKYRQKQEDNFMHKLSMKMGKIQERKTSKWDLSWGWQYPSVTRRTRK